MDWRSSWEAAQAEAQATDRLVLLDFFSPY
jgi:hypothetical protein